MYNTPSPIINNSPLHGEFPVTAMAEPVQLAAAMQFPTTFRNVNKFMEVMEQPIPTRFAWPEEADFRNRVRLTLEETFETLVACYNGDMVELVDGLHDMDYVNTGFGIALGMDVMFELTRVEVHRSNMSKIDPAIGYAVKDDYGKVIKPESYSPAAIRQMLGDMADAKPPYDVQMIVREELVNVMVKKKNRVLWVPSELDAALSAALVKEREDNSTIHMRV